ncbi:M61 family metallopeptidase [Shewanella sp. YIC-542]|uniref:M61 family metallopeptidase n=1 Tax=Shewanella mytili TaxID=3377111 RepID=UPI00398E9F74
MIHYQITAIDPVAHLFEIALRIDNPAPQQQLWLPAWLPGSYMVRDFAKNIIDIRAFDEINRPLPLQQLDKQRWQVNAAAKVLHLRYQVYAWDLSVRTAHLDQTHGFFNGSSVFLAVAGREQHPHEVEILPPKHVSHWQLATMLPRTQGDEFGFGSFLATDYDELIDHPVEMGNFTLGSFDACGIRHDVVLTGRHHCCMPRLLDDLKAICESQIHLFGTPAPFKRYLFMTQVLKNGFGGLEHRASTALHCSRHELPQDRDAAVTQDYRNYLTLCSHEYFHSWNVKRIKPAAFIPYQLAAESYTPQLWAYEGITSYYDDLMTYRSGRIDKKSYLALLSQTFTRVYRAPGRWVQSLSESSFNAWTKFYKQDENAANAIVSYYTKGALFALYLDLTLRRESHGEKSLDDLMRMLWQRFGLTGVGTQDNSHQQLYAELLGRDASAEFAWLDKTEDLPLASLLAAFGVEMVVRPSAGSDDLGGGRVDGLKFAVGARYKAEPLGVRITNIVNGLAAHEAGLCAKDLLIAADGLQVNAQWEQTLQQYREGEQINLHWFRDDVLMSGTLTIRAAPRDTVSLLISDEAKTRAWLG